MINYIKLIRPYQWIKNLFCFCGVVFGFHFNNLQLLLASLFVFIAFCLVASSVYTINDIVDVKADQEHPKKRKRPIASGVISVGKAKLLAVVLSISSILVGLLVNRYVAITVLIYLLLNLYYSQKGKHIVLLDVFIITFGFLLRVISGTAAIGIPVSEWLILCVVMLTLFLGFGKRRAELMACELDNSDPKLKRLVLEHYESSMLDIFIAATSIGAILSYSLFLIIGGDNPNLIYTMLFVIYGIFRYIYRLYSKEGGQDTANDLLDDKHLIIAILLWIISYLVITLL